MIFDLLGHKKKGSSQERARLAMWNRIWRSQIFPLFFFFSKIKKNTYR